MPIFFCPTFRKIIVAYVYPCLRPVKSSLGGTVGSGTSIHDLSFMLMKDFHSRQTVGMLESRKLRKGEEDVEGVQEIHRQRQCH